MEFTKFKVYEYKPLTIGLWRPFVVEEGFVKDYIKRSRRRRGLDDLILL